MGDLMTEFFGIRAKSYCFKTTNKTIKKIKGIKKNVVSKITINDFKNFIFHNKEFFSSMYTFRSINHSIYTQNINKKCFSGIDDKRFQVPNSFKTLPWDLLKSKLMNKKCFYICICNLLCMKSYKHINKIK